ncbi:PREDICTED: ATP-dependent zinc metalloprotease FtsH-like [Brassica oleracea var. oleracea]|uniref:ATP-dependent zinc metalloprotease FtsH-like n=1 Tax=Brassica oleracea var. oleracea TaxID=109376 RepID=UPI0006A6C320|nr:PREDICTED: ATP-dependent zinc metalloprotease FtsH-like [Brassica oleracea var. oleracea]
MANMKTKFMALWDGFSTDLNARVMVLAATNRPSELDEAILKRLPQAFEIGMPDRKEKAGIFKVVLKGERVEPDIDYHHVARLCEGYIGYLGYCHSWIWRKLLIGFGESSCYVEEDASYRRRVLWVERGSREPDEVEAAISGISKLLVSQFINLQSGSQDKTIHRQRKKTEEKHELEEEIGGS